jgi:hypothetical protein
MTTGTFATPLLTGSLIFLCFLSMSISEVISSTGTLTRQNTSYTAGADQFSKKLIGVMDSVTILAS